MLFCCFRNKSAAEGLQDALPAKLSELDAEEAAVENGANRHSICPEVDVEVRQTISSGAGSQQQPTPHGFAPHAKPQQVSQDSVMRVVALLQELLGLTSERMQVSRIMALLCQRLSVSWACLSALSVDGRVFQHIGSAYQVDSKIGTCSFSSCRTNSGLAPGSGAGRGPPSRTSSTSSIAGSSTVVVGMSDPHLLHGSDTSIEAVACSKQPLTVIDSAVLLAGANLQPSSAIVYPTGSPAKGHLQQPHSFGPGSGLDATPAPILHPLLQQQQQRREHQPFPVSLEYGRPGIGGGGELRISSWPIDWQLLHRERSMRAFTCLPICATNGSGDVIGCLSLGSTESFDWSRQFWWSSMQLITGWAAGAITATRATARASFYSRLFGATDLDGLARAFAYDMPVSLADGAAGPGTALPEIRLALVSSRLQHAVVYAAPLLQVSGRLGVRRPSGPSGVSSAAYYANGSPQGGMGVLGPCVSGVSMAGVVIGSGSSIGMERGLDLGGPLGASPQSHPVGPRRSVGMTTFGYDGIDGVVLGGALDLDDQASGCSRSNSAGGAGGGTGAGMGGLMRRSGADSGGVVRVIASPLCSAGAPAPSVTESPPVDCMRISTDSTLLMSVLEAGDIMIIKDALQYFGGGRMVARDLALNNTRPATAGTLVILPLVHRCRSLGCVYIFARNEFNFSFSRAAWGDLAAMLSRAVFSQLVGKLRHEWYSVLSEDPEPQTATVAIGKLRAGGVGGATGNTRGRVRRVPTGNSLCSNASSLRPSFEVPSGRSFDPFAGVGTGGGISTGEGGATLAAAAAVLEHVGHMLPDSDYGPAASAGGPSSMSPGGTTVSSSARHRVPAEHASIGNYGTSSGGSGGGTAVGSWEPPILSPAAATTLPAPPLAKAPVPPVPSPGGLELLSVSPSSISFKLPAEALRDDPAVTARLLQAGARAGGGAGTGLEKHHTLAVPGPEQQQVAQQEAAIETAITAAAALERLESQLPPTGQGTSWEWLGGRGGRAAAATVGLSLTVTTPTSLPTVMATDAVGSATEVADVEADDGEEVSGSSRELQGWPELVDILYDMHHTRNVSVYLAAYRGQAVAIKMMRASNMSLDGRPGHLESEAPTIAAQQLLSTVRHPNVLRVLMVYPLIYEVVAGKAQRVGGGSSFIAHSGGGGGIGVPTAAAAGGSGGGNMAISVQGHALHYQHVMQQQQHPSLNMWAHAMSDLLAGAGAPDASGVGVYLTAVLPRREKFKRGLALMLELFPSLSLREAIQRRMLVGQPQLVPPDMSIGGIGGLSFSEQFGTTVPYMCVNSQSDAGHPCTPMAGPMLSATTAATAILQPHLTPYLPALPEIVCSQETAFNNVDSSPGLAMTGASNSGGANVCVVGNGPSGYAPTSGQVPPIPLLLAILSQIVAGMAALHAAGLAHGELRPENILLALPKSGGSFPSSGHQDGALPGPSADSWGSGGGVGALRASPKPTRGGGVAGSVLCTSGGALSGRVRGCSDGGGSVSSYGGERGMQLERPNPGRPITPEVIVKIKDAGMTLAGFSKGSQMVRKLLQRNRNSILPYLPPEVHRGERYGRSADVYMFGLLMWELYTGSVAFSNLTGTPSKLLQTIIADGVRPPWPEGTLAWYQALASRCWASNPKQRPSFRRIHCKLAEVIAVVNAAAASTTTASSASTLTKMAGWAVGTSAYGAGGSGVGGGAGLL